VNVAVTRNFAYRCTLFPARISILGLDFFSKSVIFSPAHPKLWIF
jgi:hypothetical protein